MFVCVASLLREDAELEEIAPEAGNQMLVVPCEVAIRGRPDCTVPRGNMMLEAIRGPPPARQSATPIQSPVTEAAGSTVATLT